MKGWRIALAAVAVMAFAPSVSASTDQSNDTTVRMNMEKVGSATTVCAGDSVTFRLTTRLLGGAPGFQLRNVQATDTHLPGVTLVPGGQYFVGGDLNNNGFLDFVDGNGDGKSDEEFVWEYTLVYTASGTNTAADSATVFFNDADAGLDPVSASDSWDITVVTEGCQGNGGPTTTTAGGGGPVIPETGSSSSAALWLACAALLAGVVALVAVRRRPA